MNKKLLALAIGAAAAMPFVAEAAGPTLYGKVNVTVESRDDGTTDVWHVESNDSRLGVKGDAETGVTGLTGLYQAEFSMNVDDGAGPFGQRNILAGLKGSFGQVQFGYFDTPVKTSQGKVDQFNDLSGDIKNIMPGENRGSNMIQYSTPKLADMITVTIAAMPGENTNVDGTAGNETGIADMISASVVLQSGDFYAALGLDQNASISGSADADDFTTDRGDIVRLVAMYTMDALELGAIFQTTEEVGTGADAEDTAMLASIGYKMSEEWKLKAQYGVAEGDTNNAEKTLFGIGADYKLGKSTKLFGLITKLEEDNTTDTELTTIALGLEQNF